jgi:hypothetical protein
MLNYSNNVELPLNSKGKNPWGKCALRQVVSMVIQFERADDVATAGGISNDNPPERPIALQWGLGLGHVLQKGNAQAVCQPLYGLETHPRCQVHTESGLDESW